MPTQPPNTLAANALTTLDQVKLWLGQDDLDASQNDRLTWLVNAASLAVLEYAQREFAPISAATTRTFALKRDGYVSFGKWDLQSASLVQIDTESGGSPTTITTDQYQLLPIDAPHGVYRSMRFYTFSPGPVLRVAFGLRRHISVTGTWGFAAVPSNVEQATIITAAKWFRRDQNVATPEFIPGAPLNELSLPYDARLLLSPYRRVV